MVAIYFPLLDQVAFASASKFSELLCHSLRGWWTSELIEVGEPVTMKASVNYVGIALDHRAFA
jgi:hypothetical protein